MHAEHDPMNQADHQSVIDDLESVIGNAKALMVSFEATGMDEAMPDDYLALHDLYRRMVDEQRRYTQEMLTAKRLE